MNLKIKLTKWKFILVRDAARDQFNKAISSARHKYNNNEWAFMCFISYIQCNPHTKARAANDPCAAEIKKVVCDKHIIISTAIHVAWANEYKTVDQVK